MNSSHLNGRVISYRKQLLHIKHTTLPKYLFIFFILFLAIGTDVKAQEPLISVKEDTSFTYDEIPVYVIIEGYGDFYLDCIYTTTDQLYVNIIDLFRAVKIPCITGLKGDSVGGFIELESRPYFINFATKQIKIGDKIINPKNELVKEMGTLYLESSFIAEHFGINMSFNYRALTIILKANFELPVIKQMRLDNMRKNISKLKGEISADTIIKRSYHFLKLGMLDWSASGAQTYVGSDDYRLKLGMGGEFLYGETDISLDYYNKYKFDTRQMQFTWRWVDNEKKFIKQAQVGKIFSQAIAFINSPVIGAILRNSPTTVRKASGYYTVTEHTEPNWTVELYINNVLVDYTKADASGLFVFKVPIVYGYTTLKYKIYGPLGEERAEERTINIPYTVVPTKELDYSLALGLLQDNELSRYGKLDLNYGLNRFVTFGGGMEYLSSIPKGALIPYAKVNVQPFSKMTLNAEYDHGVKTKALLDFYFLKNALIEISYSKYVKGQVVTRFNSDEERVVKLSLPFRIKKFVGYFKADYSQLVYNVFLYNQANVLFSMYYLQFSANSSTSLNWTGNLSPNITSDLVLSYRLSNGLTIRPSTQYNVNQHLFMNFKVAMEKSIPKGNIAATYERGLTSNSNFFNLGFKYDLPFSKVSSSASYSNGSITTSEGADGSMAFGGGNHYVYVSNASSVTKGGIKVYPFLDLNNNGVLDNNEPMMKLTSIRINGSRPIFSNKDSIIRIPDLNAFVNYTVEFSDADLENIAWRFKNKIYSVLVDPNQFKRLDVPIVIVGEVSGTAYMNKDGMLKGIGRITIQFRRKNSDKVVAETLSESDGYIYYMGLSPGEYVARIDPEQLSNLEFVSDPPEINFKIKSSQEGDIVEGINFTLSNRTVSETPKAPKNDTTSIIKNTQLKTDSVNKNIQLKDSLAKPPLYQNMDSTQQTKEKESNVKDSTSIIKNTQLKTDSVNKN
ncbi:MAG: hypothetical protein WCH34_13485, partial [Bacteroidota bacterium]